MRTYVHILVLACALAVPAITAANPAFDEGELGRMRGILDTCGKVNALEASHYLLQMKALIGNATRSEVDQAARTEAYQQAYQAVTAELGSLDRDAMIQACNGYLGTSN